MILCPYLILISLAQSQPEILNSSTLSLDHFSHDSFAGALAQGLELKHEDSEVFVVLVNVAVSVSGETLNPNPRRCLGLALLLGLCGRYRSTRGGAAGMSFEQAVFEGPRLRVGPMVELLLLNRAWRFMVLTNHL